jgi:hypothetical protein
VNGCEQRSLSEPLFGAAPPRVDVGSQRNSNRTNDPELSKQQKAPNYPLGGGILGPREPLEPRHLGSRILPHVGVLSLEHLGTVKFEALKVQKLSTAAAARTDVKPGGNSNRNTLVGALSPNLTLLHADLDRELPVVRAAFPVERGP